MPPSLATAERGTGIRCYAQDLRPELPVALSVSRSFGGNIIIVIVVVVAAAAVFILPMLLSLQALSIPICSPAQGQSHAFCFKQAKMECWSWPHGQ